MTNIIRGVRVLVFFTLLTGVAYPLCVTLLGNLIFPQRATGSIILKDGKPLASELIAISFKSAKYFWPRASAIDFNPLPSGGSNLGPTSLDLKAKVEERHAAGLTGNLAFASASGLDPHISPSDARAQIGRIALERRLSAADIESLARMVVVFTESPQYGIFGDPRVNVLRLNLALDERFP